MKKHISPSRWHDGTRWTVFCVMATGLLLTSKTVLPAADPDFVGVLALAADQAEQLGLADEVQEQLKTLVDQRMSAATELALSIKDLPPTERARRLAPFVEESERMGMKLLSLEQRSMLNQLRLRQGGMSTLAEAEMAQMLQLSEAQQKEIQRLMGERAVEMTRGGETEQRRTRDAFERSLRAVLSSSQKATWDQMAGLGPGPAAPEAATSEAAKTEVAADTAREDTAREDTATQEGTPAKPEMAADATATDAAPADAATDQTGAKPAESEPNAMPAEKPAATAAATETPQPSEAAPSPSDAQVEPKVEPADADVVTDPANVKLRFNFRFQPWGDVLDWLAEQADLSLQSELVPDGTLNYSDTREYTPTEAIDLINGILLNQGYTLVRRGRLLTVMDLEEEVPDVLVEFVPVEKLDERGEFELIKTVFHVVRMEPSDVEQEIGQLLGPGRSMVVMPKARQILITETAGKLRTIRDVIERAENPSGADGGLTEIKLKYITFEEVLGAARPLLGLGEGENVGDDISIAQDSTGGRIFANGSKEKVQLLEDLVERLDVEREVSSNTIALEQPQLLTHAIQTADPEGALAVMQTLLAGLPEVRMSLDTKTNKIIALAKPSEHKTISETIKQLEGEAPRIEVIQLRRIDPQMAVVAIGNFFSSGIEGESTIKIDADPTSMRLYVRATDSEIADIKNLIEKLEGPVEGSSDGGTLRFIPLGSGAEAMSAVETARRLWLGPNKIEMSTPAESGPSLFDLREVNPAPAAPPAAKAQSPARPQTMPSTSLEKPSRGREVSGDKVTSLRSGGHVGGVPVQFVSLHPDEEQEAQESEAATTQQTPVPQEQTPPQPKTPAAAAGSDIRIEFTQNGVLIASEDTAALDRFEDLLRKIAPPMSTGSAKNFTVYFLKFCKADVARQLISDILGGTSSDTGGGSLVGDVAATMMGSGGGILGALLGGGAGGGGGGVTTVQATGAVSIVADSRLNCLVVQALPVDLQLIEQLLKVIDREGSITDIQTAGKPHIIPIVYMNAEDVATVVKEAYANRIAQSANSQRGGQPNPADLIRALRGGRGGSGGTEVKSEEAKMTIAVDGASNSLIVTAPEQLFEEVRDLVAQIDQSNSELTEEVVVVSMGKSNPEAVQKALASIMGQSSSSRSSSNRSSSSSSTSTRTPFGGGASSGDIQARIDAFRRMQSGGFGGGAPSGLGGSTGGRGSFGGATGGRGGIGGSTGGRGGTTRGSTAGGRGGSSRRGR